MENTPSPEEAAATLAEAEESAARLAGELRLPSYFSSTIGAAIAFQIGTAALGFAIREVWAAALLLAGLGVFLAVAVVQLVAFRRINGAWVWPLANRVVFGAGTTATVAYCLGLGAAIAAATLEAWWLVPIGSLAGGVGYALGGRRWLREYRHDPVGRSGGESRVWLVLAVAGVATGLLLLVSWR